MKILTVLCLAVLLSSCAAMKKGAESALECPIGETLTSAACAELCALQTEVAAEVCEPVCNFLANSGKTVLQDKVK